MKIGLAQINTTVVDMRGNLRKVSDAYMQLCSEGAELVVFPELVTCGYPPRDLLLKGRFVEENLAALESFAGQTSGVPALVGFVARNGDAGARPFFNSAACCREGRWEMVSRKCLLPTYDVFDEARYFEPGPELGVLESGGRWVGVTICEDLWNQPEVVEHQRYQVDPVRGLAEQHLDLVVNLSASPWHVGKERERVELLQQAARTCGCPVAYCNLVGGNDELIFDGHSMVVGTAGAVVFEGVGFEEELALVDIDDFHVGNAPFSGQKLGNIRKALVLGLRDYALKSGFSKDPLTMGLASNPSQSSRIVEYRPRKSRFGTRSPDCRSSAFIEGYSPY